MIPTSIVQDCSKFLNDSAGKPLLKLLPSSGEGFRKIKVRKRNNISHLEGYFDEAYYQSHKKSLMRRVVIAHSMDNIQSEPGKELFYIFPFDGYKVLFNTQVPNYYQYMNKLKEAILDSDTSKTILKKVFMESFVCHDLSLAQNNGYDVLIYDLKTYYAIRKSLIDDYKTFISY